MSASGMLDSNMRLRGELVRARDVVRAVRKMLADARYYDDDQKLVTARSYAATLDALNVVDDAGDPQ